MISMGYNGIVESQREGLAYAKGGGRVALNPQNLTPVRSEDEARRKGREGGIKSGEARRRKKSMRELAQAMLSCRVTDDALKNKFASLGFDAAKMTMAEAMIAGQIMEAMKNPNSFKTLLELVEPRDEIKIDTVEDLTPLAKLLEEDSDG